MQHQVWLTPIQQAKTHQNIVILDYDDTLLPTTFLHPENQNIMVELAVTHRNILDRLQTQIVTLL